VATVTGTGPVGTTRDARVGSGTVLAVASIGAFLAFLDTTVVNVAFPSIRASFGGARIGELSWVLNAYNIVLAATLILFGLGPPIGGALVKWGDWRWALLVNLPVGVAALWRPAVGWSRAGRRAGAGCRTCAAPPSSRSRWDCSPPRSSGNDWGWTSPGVLLCAVGSVVAAVGSCRARGCTPARWSTGP
jgi:MFS family permease